MILHKEWKDYTEKEINQIKRERCNKCKYMSTGNRTRGGYLSPRYVVCMYIDKMHERRGIRPEECEHWRE